MCSGIAMIGRIVIGILSLVFGIAGLAIIIAGALVKANSPVINSLLDAGLAAIKEQSGKLTGGTEVDTSKFDINELVGSLAIVFIIIGCVFLFLAILGIAGACCTVRILLKLYMLIIVIFLAAQIVFVVILAGDRKLVTDPPKDVLKESFTADYAGMDGKNTISLLWNALMTELQCCGVVGVADITSSQKYNTESKERKNMYTSPVACCKPGMYVDHTSDCVHNTTRTADNSNYMTPCYEEIIEVAFQGIWFIIVALATIGFHTLLAFFSYAILSETSPKNSVGAA